MDNQEKKVLNDLEQWLGVVLDCVDYTRGACAVTEMVGAVLPNDVISNARGALTRSAQRRSLKLLGLFYPETNERYLPFKEFETQQEALDYMSQENGFIRENPQGDALLAWINMWTGDILVLRQPTKRAADGAKDGPGCEKCKDNTGYCHYCGTYTSPRR